MRPHANLLMSCVYLLTSMALPSMAMADAPDPAEECDAAIMRASVKNTSCLMLAHSRFVRNEKAHILEAKKDLCHRNFRERFSRALKRNGEENCTKADPDQLEQISYLYYSQVVGDTLDDPSDPVVEDLLFGQPGNDNTCGIRQLLLAQDELTGARRFRGDILAVWTAVRAKTLENYPPGTLDALSDDTLLWDEDLFTKALPATYDPQAVDAAGGGPQTLPSSAIMVASTLGLQFEKLHIDEAAVGGIFGDALVAEEKSKIETEFPGSVVEYSVENDRLVDVVSDPEHYYMIVVYNGGHWIGATTRHVSDSASHGRVPSDPTLEGLEPSGIIMEFSLAP